MSQQDDTLGDAGWSSPVARQAHNLKVTGSNPVPATNNETTNAALTGGVGVCGPRHKIRHPSTLSRLKAVLPGHVKSSHYDQRRQELCGLAASRLCVERFAKPADPLPDIMALVG